MKNDDLILEHGDITIDLNKIELKKIYKNWREVCDCLDIDYNDYSSGKRKKLLIKKLNSRVDFKIGINTTRDYKFTKFKSKPMISMHGVISKNKIVKLALVHNIAKYVVDNKDKENSVLVFSWDDMMRSMGIVNNNYLKYKYKKGKLANDLDITEITVDDFYDSSKPTIKRSIETSLNSLQKDGALIWYQTFKLYYESKNMMDNYLIAEDEHIKLVLEAADKAYEKIYDIYVTKSKDSEDYNFATKKYKAIGYMSATETWGLYYSLRCDILTKIWNEKYPNNQLVFTDIYKVVKIVENMYRFEKYWKVFQKYDFKPEQVGQTIQDVIMSNAESRHDKAISKVTEDDNNIIELTDKELMRLEDNYLYDFWCTLTYCMEDAYDKNYKITNHIIDEINI